MAETSKPKQRAGSPRSAARLAAVQALYQTEITGVNGRTVIGEFTRYRIGHDTDGEDLVPADETLFAEIVNGTLERQADIDPMIVEALTADWPLERLEIILRAILRAATFELIGRIDVPARVVVTEYVDVAHAFFAGKEPGLVNGVLDRIARRLRVTEFEAEPREPKA